MPIWRFTAVRSALPALTVLAVFSGCAHEVDTRSFDERVLEQLPAVFPEHQDSFRRVQRPDYGFGFYAGERAEGGPVTIVQCRETVVLSLVVDERPSSLLQVGRCPEHATRIVELVQATPAHLAAALKDVDYEAYEAIDLRSIVDLSYRRTSLPGGGSLHYFPVILEGHGELFFPTVVRLGEDRAIVAQATIHELCFNPDERIRRLPYCSDTRNRLSELIRRLE
jgi:hypothetical protein